jgi:hypothetical protein
MTSMRFVIMHKTNAHWESGAIPSPELIARVGTLLGELAKAGVLLGAEGLRASSEGVRLRFAVVSRRSLAGPQAEAPYLIAVAARLHVAPPARAAARRVQKQPGTRIVGTSADVLHPVRSQEIHRRADDRPQHLV